MNLLGLRHGICSSGHHRHAKCHASSQCDKCVRDLLRELPTSGEYDGEDAVWVLAQTLQDGQCKCSCL